VVAVSATTVQCARAATPMNERTTRRSPTLDLSQRSIHLSSLLVQNSRHTVSI